MITIRNFEPKDVAITWELKFNTIRNINSRDYTEAQTKAWAPDNLDMSVWRKRISDMAPFIAEFNGNVVGFADLQSDGYIDHFFCHADYQGLGVGRALMEHIYQVGRARKVARFYSEVSLTARPFYEHLGFSVVNEQQVKVNGEILTNFLMEKAS